MLESQFDHHEAFSVVAVIDARLRRVSIRVVDAFYLAGNQDHIRHVIQLVEQTGDPELYRLIQHLQGALNLPLELYQSSTESINATQESISVEPDEADV